MTARPERETSERNVVVHVVAFLRLRLALRFWFRLSALRRHAVRLDPVDDTKHGLVYRAVLAVRRSHLLELHQRQHADMISGLFAERRVQLVEAVPQADRGAEDFTHGATTASTAGKRS